MAIFSAVRLIGSSRTVGHIRSHPWTQFAPQRTAGPTSYGSFVRFKTWVVQKYGGTSLGTPEKLDKVTSIVKTWHQRGPVACVVSALSSHTKAEGTTSRLLNAARAAIDQEPFQSYLDAIHDTHMAVIDSITSRALQQEASDHVEEELDKVKAFCTSLGVIRELSPRSHDMIVGAGERLSAGLIARVLRDHGVPAEYVNLSHVFGDGGLDASHVGYHRKAQRHIRNQIDRMAISTKVVPVISGYMGDFKGGIIEAVGRGYSDLTAALVAAAMRAKVLQVWKESDGIFTANPTKVADARLLHQVTPQEAAELTYFGNEVLHPFTMECAMEAHIPIHILNTFKPNSPGTIVDPNFDGSTERETGFRGVVAIVSKKGVNVLNIASNRMLTSVDFLAKVFEQFAKHEVKVDLISTSEANLSMAAHESTTSEQISALTKDLASLGKCTVMSNRAIVSVIGEEMRHQIGIAAAMFSCLASASINFEMITQGASEINMSTVIKQEHADAAIKALHDRFLSPQ